MHFLACYWAYCGEGTCVKNLTYGQTCQCNRGYTNLLNISSFPCYSDCTYFCHRTQASMIINFIFLKTICYKMGCKTNDIVTTFFLLLKVPLELTVEGLGLMFHDHLRHQTMMIAKVRTTKRNIPPTR